MPVILNIETSTTVCSVCLSENGKILSIREENDGYRHAEKLHVFIDEVLRESGIHLKQVDAIAVSKGPGSYTGLRIGVSAAKGYCYALNIPLLGINTLESMAAGWIAANKDKTDDILICPMIDARRMEVFTACFDINRKTVRSTSAEIVESEPFINGSREIIYFGDGAAKCIDVWSHLSNYKYAAEVLPSSRSVSLVAEEKYTQKIFEDVAYFEPFYYKDFQATTPKKVIQKN